MRHELEQLRDQSGAQFEEITALQDEKQRQTAYLQSLQNKGQELERVLKQQESDIEEWRVKYFQ